MDNSLKWFLFNIVSGQMASDSLSKWGEVFLLRIWLFFIPEGARKYSQTNSYNFAITLISQHDHLTAGAWAVCDWLIEWPPLSKNMFKKSQNQTHVLTKVFPKNHLFRHSGHPTNLSGFKLILSGLWFNTIYLPMEFTSSISVPMVTYKSKLRLTFSPNSGRLCSKCTGLISVHMKALYSYVSSKSRNG